MRSAPGLRAMKLWPYPTTLPGVGAAMWSDSHPTIGGVWEWESTMAEMESEDNRTCHIRVRKRRGPAGRTGALLDRLTHHTHILEMNGESYRLKRSRESAGSQPSEEPDAA